MGNSSSDTAIAQRVDHASKTGVLSLRELRLQEIPPQAVVIKDKLRTFDVSYNRLQSLPSNISSFTHLRTLSCNNNQLESLPTNFGDIAKLETLHLHSNVLHSLPASMASLTSLKILDLSFNQLDTLPSFLYTFKHLNFLNLSHNQLTTIPEDNLQNLSALELNLSHNALSSLPPVLASCQRLRVLRVENNRMKLNGVPQALLETSNVSLLCLEGNLFQDKQLQELPGYQQYVERYSATRRKKD